MLVVGLGNPGQEYVGTRHNVGWWVLDLLRSRTPGLELRVRCFSRVYVLNGVATLAYPHTYMNLSGKAVACLYKPNTDLVVIHDDLDLPVGRARVRFGGSSGGHRGVASIIDHLGTDAFWRVKVGIGKPERKEETADYVLTSPAGMEKEMLLKVVEFVSSELVSLIETRNFMTFQQRINSFRLNENS
ncbi:aminoacyl-tRNA hydrolase [Coprothermobacteraceae bacterium]|nr:aminoacyl-tRNA hydrolase [Coprothermobacteraceae bacterium]